MGLAICSLRSPASLRSAVRDRPPGKMLQQGDGLTDTPCMSDALRRAIRTLAQLVVSGALTATINKFADGLTAQNAGLILMGWQIAITFCQNWLEDNTNFPSLLKSKASSGANPVTQDPPLGNNEGGV